MRYGCNVLDMLSWHASVMATSVWKMFLNQTYHKGQRYKRPIIAGSFKLVLWTGNRQLCCQLLDLLHPPKMPRVTMVKSFGGEGRSRKSIYQTIPVIVYKRTFMVFGITSSTSYSNEFGTTQMKKTFQRQKSVEFKRQVEKSSCPKEIGWVNEQMTLDRFDDAEQGMCTSYK